MGGVFGVIQPLHLQKCTSGAHVLLRLAAERPKQLRSESIIMAINIRFSQ